MFIVNEDNSIYCTRGDNLYLYLEVQNTYTGGKYIFKESDVVRFTVYGKKNCKNVVFQKVVKAIPGDTSVGIELSENETSRFELTSKPKDYWYDVELINTFGTETILGYDEDGAKIFRVFPEGDEINTDGLPEETPDVEADIDINVGSTNPVQNRAVALEFLRLYKILELNGIDLTVLQE